MLLLALIWVIRYSDPAVIQYDAKPVAEWRNNIHYFGKTQVTYEFLISLLDINYTAVKYG